MEPVVLEKKKPKVWLIILLSILGLIVLLAVAAGVIWHINEFTLALTMEGPEEITLEYGESYEEPGASAVFYGTLLVRDGEAVEVVTGGSVDATKIGTYELTYTAAYHDYVETARRVVHIVDTKAPVITLAADPEGYTLPSHTYDEEGFTATDNYDGDITSQVERLQTAYSVIYSVTDSSGNWTQVSRIINYDDPVAPEITLLGETAIAIEPGTDYTDPGFTAADNCDGDITEKVEVTGEVEEYVPGDYTITYTVSDNYGNTTTVTRTVTVNDYDFGSTGGVIYLTFDDGPCQNTPYLLDILAKYGVKATFFVCNTGYGDVIARAAAEGHTIAIHSATHNYGQIYASEDAYFADLYLMRDLVTSYTGQVPNLIRFPGGSSNTVSSFNPGIMTRLTQEVQERGFYYFDWNVDSNDAGGAQSTEEIFYNVIKGVSNKSASVVLQHDIHWRSVLAVEKIIKWALDHGYTFAPLSPSAPGCHHGVNN